MDVNLAGTGMLLILFYVFRSVWTRPWGCVPPSVFSLYTAEGAGGEGVWTMEIPGPWSRNSDSVGVSGALEPAFDKFPSGYDADLPWEAPGQGMLARAGRLDQMASPGPHVMPSSTGFFLVAINQGNRQWQIGVVGVWKGQHGYQNTWVSSSPLHWSLCLQLPPSPPLTHTQSLSLFNWGSPINSGTPWELSKKGKWTLYGAIEPIE